MDESLRVGPFTLMRNGNAWYLYPHAEGELCYATNPDDMETAVNDLAAHLRTVTKLVRNHV